MSRRATNPSPQKRTWRSRLTGRTSWRLRSFADCLQQVPFSTPRVGKDHNEPIGLAARSFQEIDAAIQQILIVRPEVPRVKEKADPSSRLVADTVPLSGVARNGEHQCCACATRRSDNN